MEQQLGKFTSLALATSLSVPSGHVLEPPAMPGVEMCDAAAESELDRQLARLYGEIAKVPAVPWLCWKSIFVVYTEVGDARWKAQAAQQRAEEETEVLEQELRQYGVPALCSFAVQFVIQFYIAIVL